MVAPAPAPTRTDVDTLDSALPASKPTTTLSEVSRASSAARAPTMALLLPVRRVDESAPTTVFMRPLFTRCLPALRPSSVLEAPSTRDTCANCCTLSVLPDRYCDC